MSDAFVPFAPVRPAAAGDQPFRLKVLPQAQNARPFQPLPTDSPNSSTPLAPAPHAHEPKLTLHRDGDRLTRIEIRCSCGQCIELECVA